MSTVPHNVYIHMALKNNEICFPLWKPFKAITVRKLEAIVPFKNYSLKHELLL